MDIALINPFVQAISQVLPQIGFPAVVREGLQVTAGNFKASGVVVMVGIVGAKKGNVLYACSQENACRIASTMMMGMPVNRLDDMAKSALSELANMLTANAGTEFSNQGIAIDISVPTLLQGEGIEVQMDTGQLLQVQFSSGEIRFDMYLSLS